MTFKRGIATIYSNKMEIGQKWKKYGKNMQHMS